MKWDDNLTETQKQAATHTGSHACLLAGPGTGKTLVLTRRALYFVQEQGVSPEEILVLTFTRAAAQELRQRIASVLGDKALGITVSTLHSFALRTILEYGPRMKLPQPIRIADDWEERNIIEEDLKAILDLKDIRETRSLLEQLSANWEQLTMDGIEQRLPDPRFYGAWHEHREVFGYTLRGELVYQLENALQEGSIQIDHFPKYVLVDEYQDLNPCDLATIKMLTELHQSELYVAGDDDQSIYGFRYAAPEGIRRFTDEYKPSVSLTLEECRRCGSGILQLANYVAQQDPRRAPKTLNPTVKAVPGEVHLLNFLDQYKESQAIARICKWLIVYQNVPPQETLILLRSDRNKALSIPIRVELEKENLPVAIVTDPLACLDEKDGRFFIGVLRLIANPNDHLAWRTLLQIRRNGIGETSRKQLYDLAFSRGKRFAQFLSIAISEPDLVSFKSKLAMEIDEIQQLVAGTKAILDAHGIIDGIPLVIENLVTNRELQVEIQNLFQRIFEATHPKELDELFRAINTSLGDREQEQQKDAINIMTMHQAKGLSSTAVFIVGAEDEYLPGRAEGPKIEDERRLLYVSLTRARQYLYITHCRLRIDQQKHSGRNSGRPQRTLTQFLSGGPIRSENGEQFVATLPQ